MRLVIPDMLGPGGPDLNRLLLEWCRVHLPPGTVFQPGSVAIGVANGGDLLSVTAFDNFRVGPNREPVNIELSIASISPRWVNRGVVRGILHYPFCQLRVRRVTCLIGSKNERSLKFCEGLGFRREGLIREALGANEDIVILGLLREEARRWLGTLLD